jgi:hypothetical protein
VLIKAPLGRGRGDGDAGADPGRLDERYNADARGLDLNRSGADGVASLLAGSTPKGLEGGGGDSRRATTGDRRVDPRSARTDVGIFSLLGAGGGRRGREPGDPGGPARERHLGTFALLGAENVTPQIGRELRIKGIWAVVLSLIGMLVYIWIRFELRFGIGAVIASFHDVMVVLGLYALLDFEFNLTTVAAFLTLIGYSVNDTVVIFDRVRENLR